MNKRTILAKGKRVHLRAPVARDAREFLTMTRESRRIHAPWAKPPTTPLGFRKWIHRNRDDDYQALLICRNEDGAIAGVCNIGHITYGLLCSAYLGYYAYARHSGYGYMTDGLKLVTRFAFGTLGLHRVEANIQPGNKSSIRLAKRCGFKKEGFSPKYLKVNGRWRDHERWALVSNL